MKVLDSVNAETIESQVEEHIHNKSTVNTDGYRSYTNLKLYVKKHVSNIVPPEDLAQM